MNFEQKISFWKNIEQESLSLRNSNVRHIDRQSKDSQGGSGETVTLIKEEDKDLERGLIENAVEDENSMKTTVIEDKKLECKVQKELLVKEERLLEEGLVEEVEGLLVEKVEERLVEESEEGLVEEVEEGLVIEVEEGLIEEVEEGLVEEVKEGLVKDNDLGLLVGDNDLGLKNHMESKLLTHDEKSESLILREGIEMLKIGESTALTVPTENKMSTNNDDKVDYAEVDEEVSKLNIPTSVLMQSEDDTYNEELSLSTESFLGRNDSTDKDTDLVPDKIYSSNINTEDDLKSNIEVTDKEKVYCNIVEVFTEDFERPKEPPALPKGILDYLAEDPDLEVEGKEPYLVTQNGNFFSSLLDDEVDEVKHLDLKEIKEKAYSGEKIIIETPREGWFTRLKKGILGMASCCMCCTTVE